MKSAEAEKETRIRRSREGQGGKNLEDKEDMMEREGRKIWRGKEVKA